ncbi:MAG TPA: cell division protein SepF [Candidatus Nanopusillus sp.]|nr:cell division protein SepF [Candidatus Nanopusillus sp.]
MISLLSLFKKRKNGEEEEKEGYIEVVPTQTAEEVKVYVRVFVLKEFSDVKAVVDTLREGNYIVFVDVRKLRDRDIVELKKVVNRIKKTVEALNGDIVSVGNEWIIATPSFARIYRKRMEEIQKEQEL